MSEKLAAILFLLMIPLALGSSTQDDAADEEDDYEQEFRGFSDYDTWKPAAQPSTPDVILIKQKDPDHSHSISHLLKDNLPLLAVLAPLVAVAVLLPLKAYLGPAYVLYPPVTPAPPAAPATSRDRVGKLDNAAALEEASLAGQILNMIEEMDKAYGDIITQDKNS